ncbi:40S ribosomal protein mrp2, mitochondrial, partial [Ascosphaera pollenicola]
MFVAPRNILPEDPKFPSDLKDLGYHINEKDELRSIENPEEPFRYKVNVNDRYNEVRKEAFNACTRETVLSRLQGLDLQKLRLPIGNTELMPHVPILITPSIFTSKRVIVVFGEPTQDLGIWAYRTIGGQTINAGSAVNFTKEVLKDGKDASGLIIANLGQLVWYCRGRRAVSLATWEALPRESAVFPSYKITRRNIIPQNKTW